MTNLTGIGLSTGQAKYLKLLFCINNFNGKVTQPCLSGGYFKEEKT